MTGSPHVVSDVMTRTVVSVQRETPFKEIVRILQQLKVSAVPVLDGSGTVVGVVSEADLLPKEEFRDSDPSRLTQLNRLSDIVKAGSVNAMELMTTPAVTVDAGATLSRAARIMAKLKVKRLPVVDADGHLLGIVSRGDLLKVFLREDEEIAEEVRREIVAYLFPGAPSAVRVQVVQGAVTLTGRVTDTARVPVAARLVRAVEGVVDVRWDLDTALPHREPPVVGPRL
jgi:CBS domain-containing protein